jgi:hypothetical protein
MHIGNLEGIIWISVVIIGAIFSLYLTHRLEHAQ